MKPMTNKDITDIYINNGLIQTCVDCQFAKLKDKTKLQYKDDLLNDIIIALYLYDNEKMIDAHINNHMNALVTKMIINNIYSKTSKFYKDYLKFTNRTEEIHYDDEDI